MTGGELYVIDPRLPLRLNPQLVVAERGGNEGLRALLERHLRHTGSAHAALLLGRWDESAARFWRVAPTTETESVAPYGEAAAELGVS
jgi:glutamate synthase (ferredoxin)